MFNKKDFSGFQPNMVLIMQQPPAFYARLVSFLVMLFVTIAILWLCLSKVDIDISAQGKVVPSGRIKVIQSPDEGIVRKIYVKDGQSVKKGELLIDFDTTVSGAEFSQLQNRFNKSLLTVQRFQLLLGGDVELGQGVIEDAIMIASEQERFTNEVQNFHEEMRTLNFEKEQAKAVYDASVLELEKLKGTIEFNRDQSINTRKFAEQGLVARVEADDADYRLEDSKKERSVQRMLVSEAKEKYSLSSQRLQAREVEHRSQLLEGLAESKIELEEARQNYVRATEQLSYRSLKAPVGGIVQQLSIHTIGAVVSRADQLMVLIPDETSLEIEAQILNKDIGFVDIEQKSNIKVDAFEYTRYGYLEGELDWVASDSVLDEEKGPIYPARIKLTKTSLPRKVNNKIAQVLPGMNVTVDVVTGQRRLIAYFLGPILRYKDESLNER